MSGIVLASNDYITLEYRPDEQMVFHTVHQPIGIEQVPLLKDALNAGTEAMGKYGGYKWLSDDRLNGPLPPEMVEWGATDWNPRTIAAGWKYWANVVPHELVAAGTLMPLIDNLHTLGLRMQVFTNVDDALNWLATV